MPISDHAGIAGSTPVAMTPSAMSPALLSQFLGHGVRTLREWKNGFIVGSKEHRAIEKPSSTTSSISSRNIADVSARSLDALV